MCHYLKAVSVEWKKSNVLKCARQTDGWIDNREVIPVYQSIYAGDSKFTST